MDNIGEEMHNDDVTKIGALQYAQLEDSYQVICKKYSILNINNILLIYFKRD